MRKYPSLKTIILTAAAGFSLILSSRAGGMEEPLTATTPVGQGLLGQQYASLSYGYIDLDAPMHADNYALGLNQPLNTGLDAVFGYDWTRTGVFAGDRLDTQSVTAALRAFCNHFTWGKPYAEAGIGYAWERGYGNKDDSFVWSVAGGAEFQLAPAVSVTPYVKYADAPDLASGGVWTFGARANYWIDSQWAVSAGFARDDNHSNIFTVGTNFRF